MFGRKRTGATGAVALAAVLAASCAAGRSIGADEQLRARNGSIRPASPIAFQFQALDEPLLDQLLTREQLRKVVGGRESQFGQIVELRKWVAAQWRAGTPDPYPPWNAMTILDWIRQGRTGGHCGQYSQVFLQALAALGFTARYVELGMRDNPYVHFVTEVWSNDYDKWVVMDANYNLHFERQDIPLSALEVHDAVVSSTLREIDVRKGHQGSGYSKPSAYKNQTAEFYYYLRYYLKADHLTSANGVSMDRFNDMVEWEDSRTTPWERSSVATEFVKERLTRRSISDRAAVETRINQVEASVTVGPAAVRVDLRNNVLQMLRYEFRVVGKGLPRDWHALNTDTFEVPVDPAGEVIQVRGVNLRGVGGPVTVIPMGASR